MSNTALGCYIKLMCFAWREGSIPNDLQSLARLCGESPAALQAVWPQIKPCFAEDVFLPGRLIHEQLNGQRDASRASRAARSAAGAIGAARRWSQSSGSVAQLAPAQQEAPAPAPAPAGTKAARRATADAASADLFDDDQAVVAVPKPAGAVPPCPQAEIIAIYHEVMKTNPRVLTWNGTRETSLRARWREMGATTHPQLGGYKTVADGLKWWRRFFEHCAKSAFLTGRAEAKQGGSYATPTLEWLLRPTKFALILEGFYHRERA